MWSRIWLSPACRCNTSVGSVANIIIVVDAAARRGIAISLRDHARIGIPVTLTTLAIVAAYLALRWSGAH